MRHTQGSAGPRRPPSVGAPPRQGPTAEFDEFYRGTAPRVVHLVHAWTGDHGLAQECTQEAYIKAWADWSRVSRLDDPLSWVRTVARRLAISRWRRTEAEARALTRIGPTAAAHHAGSPTPDRLLVLDALARIEEPLREAVVLFYIADLSVDQIARETGSPAGTVKARLHRGRAQLAALLRDPSDASDAARKAIS